MVNKANLFYHIWTVETYASGISLVAMDISQDKEVDWGLCVILFDLKVICQNLKKNRKRIKTLYIKHCISLHNLIKLYSLKNSWVHLTSTLYYMYFYQTMTLK